MFEKLKLGAKTGIEIEKMRDGYRPAAKRGAILFFVLSELTTINTMYQYSLASYLGMNSSHVKLCINVYCTDASIHTTSDMFVVLTLLISDQIQT